MEPVGRTLVITVAHVRTSGGLGARVTAVGGEGEGEEGRGGAAAAATAAGCWPPDPVWRSGSGEVGDFFWRRKEWRGRGRGWRVKAVGPLLRARRPDFLLPIGRASPGLSFHSAGGPACVGAGAPGPEAAWVWGLGGLGERECGARGGSRTTGEKPSGGGGTRKGGGRVRGGQGEGE